MLSIKQIISTLLFVVLLLSATTIVFFANSTPALADEAACEASGGTWAAIGIIPGSNPPVPEYSCTNCPAGTTGGASCTATSVGSNGTPIDSGAECTGNSEHCCNGVTTTIAVDCAESDNPILGYLSGIMSFLAAGVGVIVVVAVTLSGVQYITSRGDPQKLAAAKGRLINALIGLFCFIFLYAFLQWLLPSGLLNGGGTGGGGTNVR